MSSKPQRPWTQREKDQAVLLKRNGASIAEIGEALGRSESVVRSFFSNLSRNPHLHVPGDAVPPSPPTVEEDLDRNRAEYWKLRHKEITKKYEEVLQNISIDERLMEEIRSLAPTCYDPAPALPKLEPSQAHESQTAVIHLSDSHVGQVVSREQTMGNGHYNFDMFLARLAYVARQIESIIVHHTNTKVGKIVVALGGDMMHGNLSHANEAAHVNPVFNQFYGAGHALAQFIRRVSRLAPEVEVECTVGNHTRFGDQKKMPTVNRFSNLDTFLYAYVEALTSNLGNVSWHLDERPFADFIVEGHQFRMLHGDIIRGGDKALGIPNHHLGRLLSITTQLAAKYGKNPPAYYLLGHFHREIAIPHAKGSILINGGFPGLDEYAISGMFNPCEPSQRFFFVHEKYGITAHYSLSLRYATEDMAKDWTMPVKFGCS